MDRTPAADRPNRIPSLNTVQWDNKKMVVGAALAGAIVFGVLSLVSGSGSDNKALEARKAPPPAAEAPYDPNSVRSEEHTSELQSLMRISYAVFCLKKKKKQHHN